MTKSFLKEPKENDLTIQKPSLFAKICCHPQATWWMATFLRMSGLPTRGSSYSLRLPSFKASGTVQVSSPLTVAAPCRILTGLPLDIRRRFILTCFLVHIILPPLINDNKFYLHLYSLSLFYQVLAQLFVSGLHI